MKIQRVGSVAADADDLGICAERLQSLEKLDRQPGLALADEKLDPALARFERADLLDVLEIAEYEGMAQATSPMSCC